MDAGTLIQEVYYAYRGKGASKVPVWGTEKSNTALAIANRKKNEWARDPKQKWSSNFKSDITAATQIGTVDTAGTTALVGTNTYFTDFAVGDTITVSGETARTIATITDDTNLTVTAAFSNTASGKTFTRRPIIAAGVQEYALHRNFFMPSNSALVRLSSQDVPFTFMTPEKRADGDVYISGLFPKMLTFYTDIETGSQLVGGQLLVSGYYIPDDLAASTDLVPVDDPNWLVYATAAELARNDPAKEDEFPNLLGMANQLYKQMVDANRDAGYLQGSLTMPTSVPQVNVDDNWSW